MGMSLKIPIGHNDHHLGPLSASVVLVAYGDFQCPYSAVIAPVFDVLLDEFRDDLCVIFRHYPMKHIHHAAELAALAAEAADQQGKFWEMYRLLYGSSASLNSENIGLLARGLQLDLDRFLYDVQRSDLIARIHHDMNGALQSGVTSTPTIFINGESYDDSSTYEPLSAAIREILGGRQSSVFF